MTSMLFLAVPGTSAIAFSQGLEDVQKHPAVTTLLLQADPLSEVERGFLAELIARMVLKKMKIKSEDKLGGQTGKREDQT